MPLYDDDDWQESLERAESYVDRWLGEVGDPTMPIDLQERVERWLAEVFAYRLHEDRLRSRAIMLWPGYQRR